MFDLSHQSSPKKRASISRIAPEAKADIAVTDYGEFDGIGMGRLSNGETFVTQRGLAALCGVQNAHIGTISRDWDLAKPRILAIRARLGETRPAAHRVLTYKGHRLFAYDTAVAKAVLGYYALDAGNHAQDTARRNRARFRGNRLDAFISRHFDPQTTAPAVPADPVRFLPLDAPDEDAPDLSTAFLMHIWGLYALSFWLTLAYLNTLREQAEKAPWNRLGLYLPLKAILEIQADALRRAELFTR
ncbi:MAG: hypothetical protein ACXU8O_07145 [Asticcacaulis sp.]